MEERMFKRVDYPTWTRRDDRMTLDLIEFARRFVYEHIHRRSLENDLARGDLGGRIFLEANLP